MLTQTGPVADRMLTPATEHPWWLTVLVCVVWNGKWHMPPGPFAPKHQKVPPMQHLVLRLIGNQPRPRRVRARALPPLEMLEIHQPTGSESTLKITEAEAECFVWDDCSGFSLKFSSFQIPTLSGVAEFALPATSAVVELRGAVSFPYRCEVLTAEIDPAPRRVAIGTFMDAPRRIASFNSLLGEPEFHLVVQLPDEIVLRTRHQ